MIKDVIFKTQKIAKGSFAFDDKIANVFDNTLLRSIPFYSEIQRMIVEISKSFYRNKSNIYDIGCSTGTTLVNLAKNIKGENARFIGIDFSDAMLKKARRKIRRYDEAKRCIVINTDVSRNLKIENASVVIMNLTLQFIKPENRKSVVTNIFNGLRKRGCFILIEKIVLSDIDLNKRFTGFYYDFKKRNNYSNTEIVRKSVALENVLIPYRYSENIKLLNDCGFKLKVSFFRWYNFCGIIAIKG